MKQGKFSPGFRFSTTDGVVLVIGLLVLLALPAVLPGQEPLKEFFLAISLPLLAFFLFCNVFCVSRPLELGWAAAFVGMCYGAIHYKTPTWSALPIWALLLIAIVIGLEMGRPSYHGIGWKLINPGLPEWWQEKNSANVKSNT